MSEILERFEPLFSPRSIAFVGASKDPGKWGFIILFNMLNGRFKGNIYPINPREEEILGLKVYRNIEELPEGPDMAVIIPPPTSVLPVIERCVKKGVRAAIVITAGFAEVGGEGERMQQEMVDMARRGGMILVGPNCNGVISPYSRLYCTMPPLYPRRGPMAIVSQSGNVAASVTREAMSKGLRFSRFISSGNEADLHTEDYLEFLGEDPNTRVILSYVEGIKDGRRFLEVARRVSLKKPIVMIKVGETAAGARAAKSHTAALAGEDATFDAACKQAGIIRVYKMEELYNVGAAFLRQPLPTGRRVGIVTAGGGWGVLTAEACAKAGLDVVELSETTLRKLDSFLPPWWSRNNPVDMVAGLREGDVRKSLETVLGSPEVDGVILLGLRGGMPKKLAELTPADGPQAFAKVIMDDLAEAFKEIIDIRDRFGKPVVIASDIPFSFFDTGEVERQVSVMAGEAETLCYTTPHQAVHAYASLVRYAEYLRDGE